MQLVMRHPVFGGQVVHTVDFHVDGTSGFADIPDALKGRFVCYLLLTQLPDAGIPEALESISQMYQFYRMPAVQMPALPEPGRMQARYGGSFDAPVYPVSEE